jgi:glycosyltransferase involved in cell wall biosynthesis
MNVLIAVPWDIETGGVTHVAATLARQMVSRGHGVAFLFPEETWAVRSGTSRKGFDALYARLRNYPASGDGARARFSWASTVWTTLPQLARIARRRGIDVINLHYPGDGFAMLVDLAERLHVPLVTSVHGSDLLTDTGPARGAGLMRLLDGADAVVTPSRVYLDSVLRQYPGLGLKARFIYNGYDPGELPARVPSREGKAGSQLVALCIAAPVHKKGIDVLLRAFHAVAAGNRLTLRLLGDGPLRSELEALAGRLGISDRVAFLGERGRQEVFDELVRCDLLVMPSRHESESFGLATLEAMACGKPVIASAVGGLVELVTDNQTGLLVPRDDPDALAQAICRLIDDAALRARLGEAGRAKAQQFTVGRMGDNYERMFTELVAAGRGA